MSTDFFKPYAQGGAAARPDSFSGMADPFQQALMQMLQSAPAEVQIGITSGFRSPETQQKLWDDAVKKYGSPEAARKWVAPPGKSQHNHGNAADLKYMSPAAKDWVHKNAAQYGLAFPLDNEDWHIELATARGGASQPAGNALGGTNALTAAAQPQMNALTSQSAAMARPQGVPWIAPPQVEFTPLALPMRRRA